MGNTLLQAGRISEAVDQYQAAVQINPSYGEARDNLGLALVQMGRIPEAMESNTNGHSKSILMTTSARADPD